MNPMDKGACNSVHYQYYGQNSNIVTMYIIGYILRTCNRDTPNGLLLHRLMIMIINTGKGTACIPDQCKVLYKNKS